MAKGRKANSIGWIGLALGLLIVALTVFLWPRGGAGSPPWLARGPADVQSLYRFAAQNRETLQYIPCYCGCGAVGHTSNFDCYYKVTAGGLVYEQHAFG